MGSPATRALLQQLVARPELAIIHHAPSQALRAATQAPLRFISCSKLLSPYSQPNPCMSRFFHATARANKGKPNNQPDYALGRAAKYKNQKKQKGGSDADAAKSNNHDNDHDASSSGPKHPQPNPEEPLDFADVASRLARHDEHFREALKKLKSGGRFNPDAIGALRVLDPEHKKGSPEPPKYYPLREVAQVVPRGGRTISILANEAAYVKAIMSAVQASEDFNQQPQRDPDNELELSLKIEPERREDLVKRAKAVCHEWRDRVRSVRQKRDKLHATWKQEKVVGPDMKRTADKELEKIIKAKMTEIDEAEKEALKAAEAAAK